MAQEGMTVRRSTYDAVVRDRDETEGKLKLIRRETKAAEFPTRVRAGVVQGVGEIGTAVATGYFGRKATVGGLVVGGLVVGGAYTVGNADAFSFGWGILTRIAGDAAKDKAAAWAAGKKSDEQAEDKADEQADATTTKQRKSA